jgi:hypothetical protein
MPDSVAASICRTGYFSPVQVIQGAWPVGKVVTIPLAPRTARAAELAIGERVAGPIFLTSDGQRLDPALGFAGCGIRPAMG